MTVSYDSEVVSCYSYCCGVVLPHKKLVVIELVTLCRWLEVFPATVIAEASLQRWRRAITFRFSSPFRR